jgi:hypothetical protein
MQAISWVGFFGGAPVRRKLDGMSAHADRSDLLDFLRRHNPDKLKNIFLVHGELEPMTVWPQAFAAWNFKMYIHQRRGGVRGLTVAKETHRCQISRPPAITSFSTLYLPQ